MLHAYFRSDFRIENTQGCMVMTSRPMTGLAARAALALVLGDGGHCWLDYG
jgi:hypothetical protein